MGGAGINAVFHDPAALTVDGQLVAAAEEERFSRRKHGKRPVPFAAWDLPEQAAAAGGFDERFPHAYRKIAPTGRSCVPEDAESAG